MKGETQLQLLSFIYFKKTDLYNWKRSVTLYIEKHKLSQNLFLNGVIYPMIKVCYRWERNKNNIEFAIYLEILDLSLKYICSPGIFAWFGLFLHLFVCFVLGFSLSRGLPCVWLKTCLVYFRYHKILVICRNIVILWWRRETFYRMYVFVIFFNF